LSDPVSGGLIGLGLIGLGLLLVLTRPPRFDIVPVVVHEATDDDEDNGEYTQSDVETFTTAS
jgi:hypothetical protein